MAQEDSKKELLSVKDETPLLLKWGTKQPCPTAGVRPAGVPHPALALLPCFNYGLGALTGALD
ncbi:hypothetical protein E2C01_012337 [Portunus trituberculatus]|uniref:Uncharacterized protein n=1 Tax=Portunus trituberculatus TaxID=210409 RepID=A0A5B7DDS6_PORTR|nr:hypothetical protein [Portunus trituberculatus]